MKYEAVIFDLDGTLVNSLQDLADAVNYALEKLGRPVHELGAYRYLVGQGVKNLLLDSLGPGYESMAEEGIKLFHEYYDVHMYDNTGLYSGVLEMLEKAMEAGVKVCVLSNKPDEATKSAVNDLIGGVKFEVVYGARDGVPIKPNPAGLEEVVKAIGVAKDRCLYVGDSKVDMLTGTSAGLRTVGVTWGFRDEDELVENGADVIVHDAATLSRLIMGESV